MEYVYKNKTYRFYRIPADIAVWATLNKTTLNKLSATSLRAEYSYRMNTTAIPAKKNDVIVGLMGRYGQLQINNPERDFYYVEDIAWAKLQKYYADLRQYNHTSPEAQRVLTYINNLPLNFNPGLININTLIRADTLPNLPIYSPTLPPLSPIYSPTLSPMYSPDMNQVPAVFDKFLTDDLLKFPFDILYNNCLKGVNDYPCDDDFWKIYATSKGYKNKPKDSTWLAYYINENRDHLVPMAIEVNGEKIGTIITDLNSQNIDSIIYSANSYTDYKYTGKKAQIQVREGIYIDDKLTNFNTTKIPRNEVDNNFAVIF